MPDIQDDPLLGIYVPVRYELKAGVFSQHMALEESTDLTTLVRAWLEANGSLMLALGDYGTGKTSFLRHLMYQQSLRLLSNPYTERIPLLIRLREHTDKCTYPAFVSEHLQIQCGIQQPFRTIEDYINRGRILF